MLRKEEEDRPRPISEAFGDGLISGPRHHVVLAYLFNLSLPYAQHLHYAPSQALIVGNASSLPSRVLRSMLKQRRILMRMH